jgi:hypothetical protein
MGKKLIVKQLEFNIGSQVSKRPDTGWRKKILAKPLEDVMAGISLESITNPPSSHHSDSGPGDTKETIGLSPELALRWMDVKKIFGIPIEDINDLLSSPEFTRMIMDLSKTPEGRKIALSILVDLGGEMLSHAISRNSAHVTKEEKVDAMLNTIKKKHGLN